MEDKATPWSALPLGKIVVVPSLSLAPAITGRYDPTLPMVHGKNRIPYRIDRRLTGLADLNMMPLSRSGCSLSLKTHNMGNPGLEQPL